MRLTGAKYQFATAGLRLQLRAAAEAPGVQLAALDALPDGTPLLAPEHAAELAEVVLDNPKASGRWRNAVVLTLGSLVTPAPPDAPGVPASALAVVLPAQVPHGEALLLELAAEERPLRLRCGFEPAPHGALRWRLQGRLAGAATPVDGTLRLPWLPALGPGHPTPPVVQLPEGPRLSDGRPLVRAGAPPRAAARPPSGVPQARPAAPRWAR